MINSARDGHRKELRSAHIVTWAALASLGLLPSVTAACHSEEAEERFANLTRILAELVADRPSKGELSRSMEPGLWPLTDPRANAVSDALAEAGQQWWCAIGRDSNALKATAEVQVLLEQALQTPQLSGPDAIDVGLRFEALTGNNVAMVTWIGTDCGRAERVMLLSRRNCGRKLDGGDWALASEDNFSASTHTEILALASLEHETSLIVVTRSELRCSSDWGGLMLEVVRWRDSDRPRRLFVRRERAYFGLPRGLEELRGGFCAYWGSWANLRLDSRLTIMCARVEKGKVIRTAPYAVSPGDFVEEWVDMPWAAARDFVLAPAQGATRGIHAALRRLIEEGGDAVGRVTQKACDGAEGGEWVIDVYRVGAPEEPLTVVVRGSPTHYYVVAVAAAAADRCGAETGAGEDRGAYRRIGRDGLDALALR